MKPVRPRQCQHTKADGKPCRATAMSGCDLCFFHNPATAAKRKVAQRAGGTERSKAAAVLPDDSPDLPIETVHDVVLLLGQTINLVRTGRVDPRVSNAVGYLAGIMLKALEQSDTERRLVELESALGSHPVNAVMESVFDDDIGAETDELARVG